MAHKPSYKLPIILNSTASLPKTSWRIVDWFLRDKHSTIPLNYWASLKMPMSTWLLIWTVVKRKRRRKCIQPKRKINIFIRKPPEPFTPCTQWMVRFFFILGKGNVTQNRKTCPSCGPGIFMAQHWDRYYCGLCHTTIKMDAETIKKNE